MSERKEKRKTVPGCENATGRDRSKVYIYFYRPMEIYINETKVHMVHPVHRTVRPQDSKEES